MTRAASCLLSVFVALSACSTSRPALRVNQAGYLPLARKVAVLVTEDPTPQPWELVTQDGRVVSQGHTQPFGLDAASNDRVHWLDFSAYTAASEGLRLRATGAQSHPFDVRGDVYHALKFEALAYFYHNRSGIPILMPYAITQRYTRPAGHLSDASVPCWRKSSDCNYRLDVSGGWYDAGDHGKYVVNGGISVWTLLNQHEWLTRVGETASDFGDGTLAIPERHNAVPDLLDEVRWELEFLLKMQVPQGQRHAGMAHHKIHDASWSGLGFRAPSFADNRALHPVSTAATLNLAAVAAQAARIWRGIDARFADRCRDAALRAWHAARLFPALYAPKSDNSGGGPYDDDHVDDEFYWAAAELYVTLGEPKLLRFLRRSPHFVGLGAAVPDGKATAMTSMTWQATAALGTISLALVPSEMPEADRTQLRASIIAAADVYAAQVEKEGYRLPFGVDQDGKYPWGSNSFVVNNQIVLALAHHFTGERRFLDAVMDGMDYLLGRNAMDQSYVSGYGERPLENPHHRFWAHQLRSSYPNPPPGVVSGGPNSGLQDPLVRRFGLAGCAPQKCYVDHIEAWSVNEITINWNAPFAWVAAYVDEHRAAFGAR